MLLANLEKIDEAVLRQMCADKRSESQTLDFKRTLPGLSDKEKHELLKDVCALANIDGGDLVYGIAEDRSSAADSIAPIEGEESDAAVRRISQVLDGVEPRIQGVKLRPVNIEGGYVLIVRVPASFDGPHSVRVNNSRRFVMRNGTTTTDLTFDQLRNAFDRTATLADRAQRFVDQRLDALMDRKGSMPLIDGPILTLHVVPIAGLAGRHAVDLRVMYDKDFHRFVGSEWGGGSRTFNLDGLIVHPSGFRPGVPTYGYTHIFRNGSIESTWRGGREHKDQNGNVQRVVWSVNMTEFFRSGLARSLETATEWGMSGPAVIRFAILHVDGYALAVGDLFRPLSQALSDRPHLVLSDRWIDDIETIDLDGEVRPLMDILWQAFDVERCRDFDPTTGAFTPRH